MRDDAVLIAFAIGPITAGLTVLAAFLLRRALRKRRLALPQRRPRTKPVYGFPAASPRRQKSSRLSSTDHANAAPIAKESFLLVYVES